jgi:hypothetical protein
LVVNVVSEIWRKRGWSGTVFLVLAEDISISSYPHFKEKASFDSPTTPCATVV